MRARTETRDPVRRPDRPEVGHARAVQLDALNAAPILAARMQDAHTQCAVLAELAQPQPPQPPQQCKPLPQELPQADEYGQHLRDKRQAIDDAAGSARRSAAFEALFAPDGR